MGWALFAALGSSPNGTVSRENGMPGGTTTNGPVGLGRMMKTELVGFGTPISPREGEGPI